MKYYYKGELYEDITPLEEGLLSTLLKAGSDVALKGMGFGELPGQSSDVVEQEEGKK